MKKRTVRAAKFTAILGSAVAFNGCLGADFFKRTLEATVTHSTIEFLIDNDAVFDLFEAGATGLNP